MRKSLALLGCLAVLSAPGAASAHEWNGNNATVPASCPWQDCGYYYGYDHHVDPRVAYRHYGEYVVNPLEMTDTRDNRGNIPGGTNSISNYREFRGEEVDNSANDAVYRGQAHHKGYDRQ